MSTPAVPPAQTGALLLRALEQMGPRPALAWYGEASRIELSGHVLANWVIKSIGHLHDEIALEPGDAVVVDLPPHWKRLALTLAAWSLGAEVTVLERDGVDEPPADLEAPRVLITDRPHSSLADVADEVLAVEAVSLAPRYSGELPPLVHDWLTEVRGSSDQLGVSLPAWSGPAIPSETGRAETAQAEAAQADTARAGARAQGSAPSAAHGSAPVPPRLLVDGDGLAVLPQVLAALCAGGGIVGPAAQVTERQAQEETVTARV